MTSWGAVGVAADKAAGSLVPGFALTHVEYGSVGRDAGALQRHSGWGWFALGVEAQWGSTAADRIDWVNDTIKCALLDTQPNQDTAHFWSDVSAHEVSGSGYTAGGAALASKSISYDSTLQAVEFAAADLTWTGLTVSHVRYAVIYKDTGTSSTSPLMAFIELAEAWEAGYSPSGQDLTLQFSGGFPLIAVV